MYLSLHHAQIEGKCFHASRCRSWPIPRRQASNGAEPGCMRGAHCWEFLQTPRGYRKDKVSQICILARYHVGEQADFEPLKLSIMYFCTHERLWTRITSPP